LQFAPILLKKDFSFLFLPQKDYFTQITGELPFAPILPQKYNEAPIKPQKDLLALIEKIKSLNFKIWQRNYYESIIRKNGRIAIRPDLAQKRFFFSLPAPKRLSHPNYGRIAIRPDLAPKRSS
jgi:hypothetical protein